MYWLEDISEMSSVSSNTTSPFGIVSGSLSESPTQEEVRVLSDPESVIERDDAKFKALWSNEMGEIGERAVYQSVSVLLISWDGEAGDLKTEEEVS